MHWYFIFLNETQNLGSCTYFVLLDDNTSCFSPVLDDYTWPNHPIGLKFFSSISIPDFVNKMAIIYIFPSFVYFYELLGLLFENPFPLIHSFLPICSCNIQLAAKTFNKKRYEQRYRTSHQQAFKLHNSFLQGFLFNKLQLSWRDSDQI